jgi:hypothetical protein
MEDNGYTVQVEDVQNLGPVKQQHNVPPQLQGCHTAIVDGYVIEGHVPVDSLERLLAERPDVAGWFSRYGVARGSARTIRRVRV